MRWNLAGLLLGLTLLLPDTAAAFCGKKGLCAPPPPPIPQETARPGGRSYDPPSVIPPPSRDPQRLAEMQRHEAAAQDAWNRGDPTESERLLRIALQMADNEADRTRILETLGRMKQIREHQEREQQRAKAESDFSTSVEDILKGFKGDFDGEGAAPPSDRDGSAVIARPPKEDPIVDPRYEPPPLPKQPPPAIATPTPPAPPEKGLHTVPPPRPIISAVPPSRETREVIEGALNKAGGNPLDAHYTLGLQRLKDYPNGDPQSVQEELSYLGGLARSYERKGGRSALSPEANPTEKVRQQLETARGNRDADALRRSAEIRDNWMNRRNTWITNGVNQSRDGSLEGAIEALAEQYNVTRNPDILNAIRYMEGGRHHVATPRH